MHMNMNIYIICIVSLINVHTRTHTHTCMHTYMRQLCEEWDFDNICTAHNGNCIGGAKQKLLQTLRKAVSLYFNRIFLLYLGAN